jgi:hypothetical protein
MASKSQRFRRLIGQHFLTAAEREANRGAAR